MHRNTAAVMSRPIIDRNRINGKHRGNSSDGSLQAHEHSSPINSASS